MYKIYILDFFIFWKLTELCRFVTYLWDDPSTYEEVWYTGQLNWASTRGCNFTLTQSLSRAQLHPVKTCLKLLQPCCVVSSGAVGGVNVNTERSPQLQSNMATLHVFNLLLSRIHIRCFWQQQCHNCLLTGVALTVLKTLTMRPGARDRHTFTDRIVVEVGFALVACDTVERRTTITLASLLITWHSIGTRHVTVTGCKHMSTTCPLRVHYMSTTCPLVSTTRPLHVHYVSTVVTTTQTLYSVNINFSLLSPLIGAKGTKQSGSACLWVRCSLLYEWNRSQLIITRAAFRTFFLWAASYS